MLATLILIIIHVKFQLLFSFPTEKSKSEGG